MTVTGLRIRLAHLLGLAAALTGGLLVENAHQLLVLLAVGCDVWVLLADALHLGQGLRQRRLAVHFEAFVRLRR